MLHSSPLLIVQLSTLLVLLLYTFCVSAEVMPSEYTNPQRNDLHDDLTSLFDQFNDMGDYKNDLSQLQQAYSSEGYYLDDDIYDNALSEYLAYYLQEDDEDEDSLFRSKLTNTIKSKVKEWLHIPKSFPLDDDRTPQDYDEDEYYFAEHEDGDYMNALLYMQAKELRQRRLEKEMEDYSMGGLNPSGGLYDSLLDDSYMSWDNQ